MSAETRFSEAEQQFVDTNILVYAYDRSAGARHKQASRLLSKLWETKRGCLSVQVLQEFYVTVTQKVPHPLTVQEAAPIIRSLSTWRYHSPDAEDVLAAISLQERFRISFWDAMIVWSATQLECPILWSEDLNDGQRFGLAGGATQIRNPFV